MHEKPFDGAITKFFEAEFPPDLRAVVDGSGDDPILTDGFPYAQRMAKGDYARALDLLQIELVKLQAWAMETGARVAVVMEGRDAAGKGGTIKRFRENLNPRGARVVALSKPSETERSQWYFQRYVAHMPSAGEIVFFDRSWYNRAVVEHVFGFCTSAERRLFFDQVNGFEDMLVRDGIWLFKVWLTVSRPEQMRRMLVREADPLKQWKLSPIDVRSLGHWESYTEAIGETFARTHSSHAPWLVIRADDKRRARLAAQRAVLASIPYSRRDRGAVGSPDDAISGWPAAQGWPGPLG